MMDLDFKCFSINLKSKSSSGSRITSKLKNLSLDKISGKAVSFEIISEPDEDLLFKLIKKHLKSKSITIADRIIHEVISHINRTYLDAFTAAQTINHLLSQNNHNINLSLIKRHYEQI